MELDITVFVGVYCFCGLSMFFLLGKLLAGNLPLAWEYTPPTISSRAGQQKRYANMLRLQSICKLHRQEVDLALNIYFLHALLRKTFGLTVRLTFVTKL